MSGGEILPVVKAVKAAGKSALSDDDVKKELLEISKESPAMKSAAEKYARRVAVKQAILLRLYEPLARLLGVAREYFDDDFAREMAEKTAHIPEERLVSPPPSVALPAMQGLSYSLDEPDLKEMYLNLLTTATDASMSEEAHPSFAEIIKQLSAAEARLLLTALRGAVLPIVRLQRKAVEGPGETDILNHLLEVRNTESNEPAEIASLPVWIDNWVRLGLVEVDYSRTLVAQSRYEWVEQQPEFDRLQAEDERGRDSIKIQKGTLAPTDFGRRFAKAVAPGVDLTSEVPDGSPEEACPDPAPEESGALGDADAT